MCRIRPNSDSQKDEDGRHVLPLTCKAPPFEKVLHIHEYINAIKRMTQKFRIEGDTFDPTTVFMGKKIPISTF